MNSSFPTFLTLSSFLGKKMPWDDDYFYTLSTKITKITLKKEIFSVSLIIWNLRKDSQGQFDSFITI